MPQLYNKSLYPARVQLQMIASEGDAALLSNGGKGDFALGDTASYRPVTADRIIADGDRVTLGGVTLTAHLTPGHTKGDTT
jgi:metallo-beta-lactamase class B